jgi:hypothetical protein
VVRGEENVRRRESGVGIQNGLGISLQQLADLFKQRLQQLGNITILEIMGKNNKEVTQLLQRSRTMSESELCLPYHATGTLRQSCWQQRIRPRQNWHDNL